VIHVDWLMLAIQTQQRQEKHMILAFWTPRYRVINNSLRLARRIGRVEMPSVEQTGAFLSDLAATHDHQAAFMHSGQGNPKKATTR
jgi:hypothetical protein